MKHPSKPTEAELEILNVLWEHGPSSVKFVNEQLNLKKETGYTTTLKFMQLMTAKNLLKREEGEGRHHIYTAAVGEKIVRGQLLKKLMDTAFRGSASEMVMQALGNHQASAPELEAIKELIAKIEKERI